MTEFRCEVVRLGLIERHPNADTLGITKVHGGYPCIVKLGDFQQGDLAVYVPVDAVVPTDDARFAFLGEHRRIKAKRLRGIFSMGLLVRPDPSWTEGQDVREALRIEKYEPAVPLHWGAGDCESDPGHMPVYTDIEGLRRWPDVLVPGEQVVITEKLHGENARFCFVADRLWVGSRTRLKKQDVGSQWWRAAEKYKLEEKLREHAPSIALYGEVHGYTGGFPYGVAKGDLSLRVFDAMDLRTRRYLDTEVLTDLLRLLELPAVPTLFVGPWDPERAREMAEGTSTLDNKHVREGIVVKPWAERWDDRIGRVILKLHGEGFLLK